MAHIQATDRNLSDLEPMEELTDGELLALKGGVPVAWSPRPGQYPSGWVQSSPAWYQHSPAWYQRPPSGYRPPGGGIPVVPSWWL